MTKMTGVSSQGCWATAWTLLASFSKTPQEVMGGRSPRPRKDSAVSARIMLGTARVRLTITWEEVEGSRCRHMIRHSPAPAEQGRGGEVLLPQGQDLAPDHPGQAGPAQEGEHHRDPEIDLERGPRLRQGRGQGHP